jgi:hypothetical protein
MIRATRCSVTKPSEESDTGRSECKGVGGSSQAVSGAQQM